LVAQNTAMLRG